MRIQRKKEAHLLVLMWEEVSFPVAVQLEQQLSRRPEAKARPKPQGTYAVSSGIYVIMMTDSLG